MATMLKPAGEAVGYLVASAAALAADLSLTLTAGLWCTPVTAAVLGFSLGTLVSYWLAKRLAFVGPKSINEFVGYFTVGLITLGQTAGMVYVLTAHAGWSLFIAKCASTPVSFVVGFVLRQWLSRCVPASLCA